MATAAVTYSFVDSTPAEAAEVNEDFQDLVDFLNGSVVHKDGSVTMTGALVLPASDPVSDNQAARKAYVDLVGASGVPAGVTVPFSGPNAPAGWLLCYGQAVSRTTYSVLFAAIGTSHGVGDGATTFNLPDLRGRAVAGLDNMGGSDAGRTTLANTLGVAGGSHFVNAIVTAAVVGPENQNHTHSYFNNDLSPANTGGVSNTHDHNVFYNAPDSSANSNFQPTMLLNWIIRT